MASAHVIISGTLNLSQIRANMAIAHLFYVDFRVALILNEMALTMIPLLESNVSQSIKVQKEHSTLLACNISP